VIVWLLLGCSLKGNVTGLVRTSDEVTVLDAVDGSTVELALVGDSRLIEDLEGHSVNVIGPRIGKTLRVREWSIVTGADGSTPYWGVLRWHGANLVLDDRNSGAQFVFDEGSYELLREGAGHLVLIQGFVVGPHVLHVMEWRVLGAEEG